MKSSLLKRQWLVWALCSCLGMSACGDQSLHLTETQTGGILQDSTSQEDGTVSTEETEREICETETEKEASEAGTEMETETKTGFREEGMLTDTVYGEEVSSLAEAGERLEETAGAAEAAKEIQTDTKPAQKEAGAGETEIELVEPAYEVMGSIYEDIAMSWADLCMLVLDCVLTTPVSDPGEPVFAAIRYPQAVEPLLITGHQTEDKAGKYDMYSFVDGKRIYQLGSYAGILYRNPVSGQFCLQVSEDAFRIYEYHSNHMIWIDTVAALPEGYSVLQMQPLNVSPPITIDNLQNYIVD